jgi:HAD superfamily hydrolase (TIGR01484 family)
MRTLPPPEQAQWLLSFDFDGTLHDPAAQPPVIPEFFEAIQWLRAEKQALWGINTGRSMEHLVQGLIESRFTILPDFAIVREREIFLPNAVGRFVGVKTWNEACERDIAKLLKKSKRLLKKIREVVEEHTGAQWIEQPGEPAGIISRTEDEMAWIIEQVHLIVPPDSALGWQRNSIYLRFGHKDYQKGSSLTAVGMIFGIGAEGTCAMGDSHNDLAMLDDTVASRIACPSNAVDDVKQHVAAQGGFLCTKPCSAGVFEGLAYFFG